MNRWQSIEGSPYPLGAAWIEAEQAYNFALYSKHAQAVCLLLYRSDDLVLPAVRVPLSHLSNKSGRIWHCRIPADRLAGSEYYAYLVDGPPPEPGFDWHAFDSEKILLDPYAHAVFIPPAFDRAAAMCAGSNAGKAPLGILPAPDPFEWGSETRPRHEHDLIIYELHVRGFTRHPESGVAPRHRGTFLGVIDKIPYLTELGITAVELMPVCHFDPQEGNYWGYSPLSFFAPHAGYHAGHYPFAHCDEFRDMVKALHLAGIEVLLDVVFNHTAEGDESGPVYSFKGIDNSTYYLVSGRADRPYRDYTGTGNTLHIANRYVQRLMIDSLRYWVQDMHVDGFRFDLASIFLRQADGTLNLTETPVLGSILSHPELATARLIAEPWDATGAYLLGKAFPTRVCCQWNDRFRDDVRRFLRGDPGMVPTLMTRLYGSDDLFPDTLPEAFHPYQSVNYITSHDGFTLYDLVSYNTKHNEANGHANADGQAENFSWNCGWEGDQNAPADVLALRERQAKNSVCLLLLSNGTPMLRAGDEFLQTQGGNNNPYNQDNETSWLDWRRVSRFPGVHRFFKRMIAFRKSHPSLCRSRFWRDDVRWYGPDGAVDMSPESRTLAFCVRGASQGDCDLYVMVNASDRTVTFNVQEGPALRWRLTIDTAAESPLDFIDSGDASPRSSQACELSPRSVVVLEGYGPQPRGGHDADATPRGRTEVRHS